MSEMIRKADLKVWWVFVWDNYYPMSRLGDVEETFATEEEANTYAVQRRAQTSMDYVEVENVSHRLGIED